ncbi:MAG: virulence factor [Chloroflexi bacterium]|nr:virulence factor [Chloroflexota bacterium]
MTTYHIVYWRDIPAQVQVRTAERRGRISRPLSARFQAAIDEAAMRAGLTTSDAYSDQFHTSEPHERDGEPEALAKALVDELETAYSDARLKQLAANGGHE